ncbi:hypothetical protein GCM10008905_30880 [Clostridium malenominatum]|uniref:Uncharacterized protein n=1 Tax=Clostridium malenominatum TaxID=1539 RepID=A0ABN1J6I9_9CLOT
MENGSKNITKFMIVIKIRDRYFEITKSFLSIGRLPSIKDDLQRSSFPTISWIEEYTMIIIPKVYKGIGLSIGANIPITSINKE